MSEENVARLQPVYAEWAKGNFHAGLELLEPDVVFRAFDAFEDEDLTFRGTEAIADFIRQFLHQWDDLKIEARTFTVAGRRVLVECRQSAIGKRSGVGVDMEIFTVWTFRGERVSEIRWLRDHREALEAAGLRE
jgi:ketosteroid isomerase-like protein